MELGARQLWAEQNFYHTTRDFRPVIAPAPGALNRALAVHTVAQHRPLFLRLPIRPSDFRLLVPGFRFPHHKTLSSNMLPNHSKPIHRNIMAPNSPSFPLSPLRLWSLDLGPWTLAIKANPSKKSNQI